MSDEQREKSSTATRTPERRDVVWEEIGFAEFPVVTTSLKRPPFNMIEFTDQIGTSADGQPLCVDMATSSIPINRVMNARRDGKELPAGVALDQAGKPTTDPHALAALLPMAEHKGYALAFLIDVLCGPLNGMPFGPHIPAMYGDLAARRNLGSR